MANISTITDLVINRLSQAKWEQLCANSQLDPFQLYLTDSGQLNGEGQQIINVASPLLSSDAANKAYVDRVSTAIDVEKRYSLTNKVLALSSGNLTCQLDDFTINNVLLSSDEYPVKFYLPPQQINGKARDLILRLEATTSEVPTIGFYSYGAESCDFESEDESWMNIEPGLNLISFTETK